MDNLTIHIAICATKSPKFKIDCLQEEELIYGIRGGWDPLKATTVGGLLLTWCSTNVTEERDRIGRRREESIIPLTHGPHELGKVRRKGKGKGICWSINP
ncbi:hypothetical protein PVAP13_8KG244988 [Panicum virgatum]|uniref:Uncharacterized protein n=1 Tax=Panicum virgatum TaxID=38727 RepID=A0A8T0PVB2_PANVG|nr:hypothetical protein PVAP13_8KG244988 [Panicum virgatum]